MQNRRLQVQGGNIVLENYKVVKPNKRMLDLWFNYNRYYGRTLSDCYKKPTLSKKSIYNYWCEMTKIYNTMPTVVAYNSFHVVLGFIAEVFFVVVRAGQVLAIPLDKLPNI